MRTLGLLSSLFVLATLAGCGGGGGSSSGLGTSSPFVGQWVGQWSDSNGHAGAITTTVAASGRMTVSLTDTTVTAYGSGEGQVSSGGTFTLDYDWDNTPPLKGSGTLASAPGDNMTGTMVVKLNGETQGNANFDLHKQGG